jgi:membrane dipeptidase
MNNKRMIIDGHQDIAWNVMTFDRDYTRSVAETRALEAGTRVPQVNGDTVISWDEYQNGRVALVFATIFATPIRHRWGDWDIHSYSTAKEANQIYLKQLDIYQLMVFENPQKFRIIASQGELNTHVQQWQAADEAHPAPVGMVLLMENAEAVKTPDELKMWWDLGVRLIGPAWKSNRFCGGTGSPGPLTAEGYALLEKISELGMVLDLSHMDEESVLQTFDFYHGAMIASHSNPAGVVEDSTSNRHLSDHVIRELVRRDAVIGMVPYNAFLTRGWTRELSRELVPLERLVDHIDYICNLAGNARHVALGTDFDGCAGVQDIPDGIDTIADLQKLEDLLAKRGYSDVEIGDVFHENWLRILRKNLPE